jgi:PiT family inorganic phosphate transporter
VTEIESPQGFSAETSSATAILSSSYFGFSLSTTQVVSGGVMGAGLGRAGGVVHWGVVGNMVTAWVVTMPSAAVMGALAYEGVAAFSNQTVGVAVIGAVMLTILGFILRQARRHGNVTADNVLEPTPALQPAGLAAGA